MASSFIYMFKLMIQLACLATYKDVIFMSIGASIFNLHFLPQTALSAPDKIFGQIYSWDDFEALGGLMFKTVIKLIGKCAHTKC